MAEYPLRQRLMDQVVQDLKNWKPEELQWPTDDELLQLAREWNSGNESIDFDCIADYAREVLARYGGSTSFFTED
jgi:hypothetical protein